MSVPQSEIDEDQDLFEVWDINAKAVSVFLALGTQWRWLTVSTWGRAIVRRTGLDYGALRQVMKMMGVKDRKGRVFAQVRLLEAAALETFDEAFSG